jgi:glucose/arabinose dehydrogenase
MSSFAHAHRRYAIAATAAIATVAGALLLVPGAAEDADGRGTPVGNGEGGVDLVQIDSFDSPVNVAFAPGQAHVYVVEQGGTVRVVGQPDPFLDIRSQTNPSGEQGLLGLAFHPAFGTNGLVYAYYTHAGTGDIVVSEFETTSPSDADESSRRRVLRIRHRFASNHNGGQLLFGPDGHLYMGTGDGGGGGDPRENAQDKKSLLGKLLRINPADPPGPRDYRSPKGNPFKGRKGQDEIYARGLRNPFRFTFDGANIAIGDVGQDDFEEVDYESPGSLRNANFGWDRFEGRKRANYPGDNEARRPKRGNHDKPIHVYANGAGGGSCAITGGLVVRDPALDNLEGRYLYADFCTGVLRSLIPALSGAQDDKALTTSIEGPSSFAANPATDEVYVTSLMGPVYRLEPEAP